MWRFILERSLIYVSTVGRTSVTTHLLLDTRKFIQEKSFKNIKCGKVFIQFSHLTRHMTIHTGVKPYKCQECESIRSSILLVHKKFLIREESYICPECERPLTKVSSHTCHMSIQIGEKPCKCQEYGKAFTYPYFFTVNKIIHIWKRPYTCQEKNGYYHKVILGHQGTSRL